MGRVYRKLCHLIRRNTIWHYLYISVCIDLIPFLSARVCSTDISGKKHNLVVYEKEYKPQLPVSLPLSFPPACLSFLCEQTFTEHILSARY